jgi:hypothetical protein
MRTRAWRLELNRRVSLKKHLRHTKSPFYSVTMNYYYSVSMRVRNSHMQPSVSGQRGTTFQHKRLCDRKPGTAGLSHFTVRSGASVSCPSTMITGSNFFFLRNAIISSTATSCGSRLFLSPKRHGVFSTISRPIVKRLSDGLRPRLPKASCLNSDRRHMSSLK